MPAYPGTAGAYVSAKSNLSPIALEKGESHYLFGKLGATGTQLPITDATVAGETIAGASIAVNLQAGSEGQPPPMVCVEIYFPAGAPGSGETIAIQEADTDADGLYITPANSAYTVSSFNANNAARVDLSPTGGKFLRVTRTIGSNNQAVVVKATRLA